MQGSSNFHAGLMLKSSAGRDCGMRMSGHSDIQMTSSIYGHLMPDRDRAHVEPPR
jgi:integrase